MTYRHDDDGRSLATGGIYFFFALLLCVCICPLFVTCFDVFLLLALWTFFFFLYLFISLFARLIHFCRSDWDILADGSNSAFIPSHYSRSPDSYQKSPFSSFLHTHIPTPHPLIDIMHFQIYPSHITRRLFFGSFCLSAPSVCTTRLKKKYQEMKMYSSVSVGGLSGSENHPVRDFPCSKGRAPFDSTYDQTPLSEAFWVTLFSKLVATLKGSISSSGWINPMGLCWDCRKETSANVYIYVFLC